MWIPASLFALFTINKETVDNLRLEAEGLRAREGVLERELTAVKINSDWLRHQLNQLNAERVQLMEKAYPGLHLPVPEFARVAPKPQRVLDLLNLFEDQGDEPTVPTNE